MRIYIAWFIALGASLASVFFIEILGNPVAALCWVERMLMFGLFLILTVGILQKDKNVRYYSLPFILLGIPAALYQQLIHWGVINVAAQPCSVGLICTAKFFNLFGFITQATLCLTAFVAIALCLWKFKEND